MFVEATGCKGHDKTKKIKMVVVNDELTRNIQKETSKKYLGERERTT